MNIRRLAAIGMGLLAIGTLTACGAGGSSSASGQQTITVALDYTVNTNHTGLFVALDKGYFAKAGLDVRIVPFNTTDPITLVNAGRADFAFSYQQSILTAQAAGQHVVSVMALYQRSLNCLAVKASGDLARPRDLDGKVYGGYGTALEAAEVKSVITADGGKGTVKSVVSADPGSALLAGRVDFTLASPAWEGVQAELAGKPYRWFCPDKYGVPTDYSYLIASSSSFLNDHPDIAKKFVSALQQGYTYAAKNPQPAADILIKANQGTLGQNRDLVEKSQQTLADHLLDSDGIVGTQTEARWAAYGTYFLDHGLLVDSSGNKLTKPLDWSTFFSNKYLAAQG